MRGARAIGVAALFLLGAGCATLSAPFPDQLTLTWLGAGGWTLSDGRHLVLAAPSEVVPAEGAKTAAAHLPKHVDLILAGRAPLTQVVELPGLARRTGARLLAGQPILDAARAEGVAEAQLRVLGPGIAVAEPGLEVQAISGAEGPVAFLVKLKDTQVLILDTPDFGEHDLDGLKPNVVILPAPLRPNLDACKVMLGLGAPRLVVRTHLEDWLGAAQRPEVLEARAELKAMSDALFSCAPWTRVVEARAFEPILTRNY